MAWTTVVIAEGHPHYDRLVDAVMAKFHADEEYARRIVNVILDELERAGTESTAQQWCPVCKTYHANVGEKTDAGELVRPCPQLPASDPRNIAENYSRS